MAGRAVWMTLVVAVVLALGFLFWPKSVEKSLDPAHPELIGKMFEGQRISEGQAPSRELVSRDLPPATEEEQNGITDCAGIQNLAAGSVVVGGAHFSFLNGCCLLEDETLHIYAGKDTRILLRVQGLTPEQLSLFGRQPKQKFPVDKLSLEMTSGQVGLEQCESTEHTLSDPTKGMALSCDSTHGPVQIKFRCQDFRTLGSEAYF